MKRLKKYVTVTRMGFRKSAAYRFNAVMAVLTSGFFLLLYYYIWKAIAASGQLNSSFAEIMTYIVVGQIVSNTVFVNAEEFIGERVRKGTIVNELKRPISLRRQTYFHLLGNAGFNLFAKGIPVALLGVVFLGISFPTGWSAIGFIATLFFALNIVFALSYLNSMLIFWTKVGWSLRMMRTLVQNLFSGVLFPLYLLPPYLTTVFDVLPFQAMVDGPIGVFQGTITGTAIIGLIAEQIVWVVVLLLFGELMWRKAKHKLTVQGG